MASSGIYWFADPKGLAQSFSVAANSLGDQARGVTQEAAEAGAEHMREAVLTGGVRNKVKTGGPRVRSWDMFESIGADASIARGRATGTYGYLNAPYYTKFQEYGTRTGIIPLMALAGADIAAEIVLMRESDEMIQRIWNNLNW